MGQMKEENKVLLGIVAELSVQLGVGQDIGPWLRIGKLMGGNPEDTHDKLLE